MVVPTAILGGAMYDVAIIGAGPAGATLARLLGPKYRVLLADRRRLDLDPAAGRLTKPCGGLLAPAAQRELARQSLGVPASVVTGPQLFAVRTIDLAVGLERLYQRFYVNVDREAFDRWLLSLVPNRVEKCLGWSLTRLEADEDAPTLHFRTAEGGRACVRARFVVGADGANSAVRRFAYGSEPSPRRYRGIQARFSHSNAEPYFGAYFDSAITDFYGWTVPKGDDLIVGLALPCDTPSEPGFDAFVDELRARNLVDGRESSREAALICRPTLPWHLLLGYRRILLVGEAAGFMSPSSAEGISYALRSGANLARAFAFGPEAVAERYVASSWPLAARVGVKAAKGWAIYAPPTRRLLMRSGIAALDETGGGSMPRAAWVGR
jgi:flavin-dependent dehydrogenase